MASNLFDKPLPPRAERRAEELESSFKGIMRELESYGLTQTSAPRLERGALRRELFKLIKCLPGSLPTFQRSEPSSVINARVGEYRKPGEDLARFFITRLDKETISAALGILKGETHTDGTTFREQGIDVVSCLKHVLFDLPRTRAYMYAVAKSVAKITQGTPENTGKYFHVCDAGSGAIPVLAIAAALADERVHVRCLEINPYAAIIAKELVRALGLSEQISIINCDALLHDGEDYDLIISETLDAGGLAEYIASIFKHLNQRSPNAVRIPQSFSVTAELKGTSEVVVGDRTQQQMFVQTAAQEQPILPKTNSTVPIISRMDSPVERFTFTLPLTTAQLAQLRNFDMVALLRTDVVICDGVVLRGQQSLQTKDLTVVPKRLLSGDTGPNPFTSDYSLIISYVAGAAEPDAEISVIPSPIVAK